MLDTIKSRVPSVRNPFANDREGQAIYERFLLLPHDVAVEEREQLSDEDKVHYNAYLAGRDNRDIAKNVLLVTAVGGILTGIVVSLTGEDDDDEDEDEEISEDDESNEESE